MKNSKIKTSLISFDNINEFNKAVNSKDLVLLLPMLNYITSNFNSRKKIHTPIKINIQDVNKTFNVNLNKNLFKETLIELSKYFEEKEQYEVCNKIQITLS